VELTVKVKRGHAAVQIGTALLSFGILCKLLAASNFGLPEI
jgi:hypothetical protein